MYFERNLWKSHVLEDVNFRKHVACSYDKVSVL